MPTETIESLRAELAAEREAHTAVLGAHLDALAAYDRWNEATDHEAPNASSTLHHVAHLLRGVYGPLAVHEAAVRERVARAALAPAEAGTPAESVPQTGADEPTIEEVRETLHALDPDGAAPSMISRSLRSLLRRMEAERDVVAEIVEALHEKSCHCLAAYIETRCGRRLKAERGA